MAEKLKDKDKWEASILSGRSAKETMWIYWSIFASPWDASWQIADTAWDSLQKSVYTALATTQTKGNSNDLTPTIKATIWAWL